MKWLYIPLFAITTLLLCLAPSYAQQTTHNAKPRDPVFEQQIYDRLRKVNPKAVPLFQKATTALDEENYTEAQQRYAEVLTLAPDFPDALRRLSYVDVALHALDDAITTAEKAWKIDPTPFNEMALASALAAEGQPNRRDEAIAHAQALQKALPNDVDANFIAAKVGVAFSDGALLHQANLKLIQLMPDYAPPYFYEAAFALDQGRLDQAEQQLKQAKALGLTGPPMDAAFAELARQRQPPSGFRWLSTGMAARFVRWGFIGIVAWLGGLVLLFLIGICLSAWTLRSAIRNETVHRQQANRFEHWLLELYRGLIITASFYFYLSLPIVILLLLALAGFLLYTLFAFGAVVLLVIVGVSYTLYAVIVSFKARKQTEEPGILLTRNEAPELWAFVETVAERVKTRPVDRIYLHALDGIAVTERGSLVNRLRDAGERCLILGLGALPGMTQAQFQAILAHEYGHFSHRDTAGGDISLHVQQTLQRLIIALINARQNDWYNPVWLFVKGYFHIFFRITLGASRLQEVMADRYAAFAFGAQNLAEGLLHVVRQNVAFRMVVSKKMENFYNLNLRYSNLYTDTQDGAAALPAYEPALQKVLERSTSPYDSHPAVKERLAYLKRMQEQMAIPVAENPLPVWGLFPDATKLQEKMTKDLLESIVR